MKTHAPRPLNIAKGSHVLYFYDNMASYIENVESFIQAGISQGEHIVLIESHEIYEKVKKNRSCYDEAFIHYVNNFEFYEMYQDFHFERVLTKLKGTVYPYLEGSGLRLWGHVDWIEQKDIVSQLHKYESSCDITVSELGFTTVCTYNSRVVPSNIFIEMMRSHEYMMNDYEVFRSPLYKSSNQFNPTQFPELSTQETINSEMDLYKQKLDFVHVVSHEVRNPLTVINAYAKLLLDEESDVGRQEKLKAIQNYVVVIDSEISHIIHTEQMLSTDALWQKSLIFVEPALKEVLEIMVIKAQTQNIKLKWDLQILGKEILLANFTGIKMIVSNLIGNAIKYSGEGDQIFFTVTREGCFLKLEIKDQGIGMAEDQLNKLYTKYEKMNQEKSGQGIGLFMVKKLVDHFFGTIAVESELNEGTTFQVKLPLWNSPPHKGL